MSSEKIKIGFSIGDINGIGPEVIVKALDDQRILKHCTPIVYASNRIISFFKKNLNAEGFNYTTCQRASDCNPKTINIINCITDDVIIQPGIMNITGAQNAYISLDAATNDLINGSIDALVTGPIHKQNMQQAGFRHNGHTGYLTEKCGKAESLMILSDGNLRLAIATEHIPLNQVADTLTQQKIEIKLELLHDSLKQDFGIGKPTIAVLGLNPHAGDNSLIGTEEMGIIVPAIKSAQSKGVLAVGPFAADGFFGSSNYLKFDAVLAMYHDQGLIPFKTLSFTKGVNFTAGLPVIRTSPDHGTAFEIAGQGIANADSLQSAIFLAIDIYAHRKNYTASRLNPIKRNLLEAE